MLKQEYLEMRPGIKTDLPPEGTQGRGAYLYFSFCPYHVLHAIEYALRQKGDTRSWNTIKQVLQTHQVITVVLPDADGSLAHHVRVTTEAEADQGEIYKKLGVNPNVIKRKRVASKKAELQ